LAAALLYARSGWPVFPCHWREGPDKKHPLVAGGFHAATVDERRIRSWWERWPPALIGTPTGGGRFVVLDVDPRHGGDGTLAALLGTAELPATPTVRTASGGLHLYFAEPDPPIITVTTGARGRGIGPGLDWRGRGGYVIAPASGTGYAWLEETRPLPLAAVPAVLMPKPAKEARLGAAATTNTLTDYGEAALTSATNRIMEAPAGEQEVTLNGECYGIGTLAGAGGVPVELALEVLMIAGRAMKSHDPRRPWRPGQVEEKVRTAFAAGLARPRDMEASDD
jgi:hypothetical protein